jgi:hypothetical protein
VNTNSSQDSKQDSKTQRENQDAKKDVSATRFRPDQLSPSHEGDQLPPGVEGSEGQAHMGAVEDQVIREKPPTDAIDKLLDSPGEEDDNHAPNDELTPG